MGGLSHTFAPSVAVVVAAYQAQRTIEECLRSLLALDYPRDRLEIIVVDNASRDATRTIVERVDEGIRLLDERRRGPAAARNTGIRHARGEIVALTDADGTVDPGWLRGLVVPLADAGVGIAGGRILARRPATACELFGEVIHDQRRAILVWRPPYVATGNWAARRSLFDALGPFDEDLRRGSDVDFSWRAVAAGYGLAFCPEAIVYHRNEQTLAGLAREGFQHGFTAPRLHQRYAALLAARARTPAFPVDEEQRAPTLTAGLLARRFEYVFRLGKRAGALCARARLTFGRRGTVQSPNEAITF